MSSTRMAARPRASSKRPFERASLADLDIDDEASFRHVGLYPEVDCERIITQVGGWDLDALDVSGPSPTATCTNDYRFADRPDLTTFEP